MPKLTQGQMNTLFKMRNEEKNNIFFQKNIPDELIEHIGNFAIDIDSDDLLRKKALTIATAIEAKQKIHCTDIERALHYAAFARKKDIAIILAMVEANPRLMLEAGDVLTPAGLLVKRVTIYEFFLGAGDPEAAKLVRECFFKSIDEYNRKFSTNRLDIEEAENSLQDQYERYRPHIEASLTQKPYDLNLLIEVIKTASSQDVAELLKEPLAGQNHNKTFKTKLHEAMSKFRADWAPTVLTEPCMHYNYQSLRHAFIILHSHFDQLCETDDWNDNKLLLVARQVIGFEMRRLPGIDRCLFAQGLHGSVKNNQPIERISVLQNAHGTDFPTTFSDEVLVGLGVDYFISIYGAISKTQPPRGPIPMALFAQYVREKTLRLTELATMPQRIKPSRCIIS
jgi:SAM-dependent methyltransferase